MVWMAYDSNINVCISGLGLLNESHPRVFQTITLTFFIAF